jgi:hypothetical protein
MSGHPLAPLGRHFQPEVKRINRVICFRLAIACRFTLKTGQIRRCFSR